MYNEINMWQCKICQYKNSNSSEKCHGENCTQIREKTEKELKKIKQEANIKEYRAFCRHCEKPVIAIKAGRLKFKVVWKCTLCKRRFFGVGKPEEIKKDKSASHTILENTVINPVEEDIV